jgi:hypothetical protein
LRLHESAFSYAQYSSFAGNIPRQIAVEGDDMLQQLHLRDRTYGRLATAPLVMDWQDSVPLTPRTLISERVRIEWDSQEPEREAKVREAEARGSLPPLVDVAMMRRLNPHRSARVAASEAARPVTLESVTDLALDGFLRNAFFLVVDGRQATDLDEVIPLRPTSDVMFVRLLPLQGG